MESSTNTLENQNTVISPTITTNAATVNSLGEMLADSLTPKAAVSYLRVSTHDQAERGGGADEGFSIPAQREANKKKAASLGALVVKEFVDRGASARSADRPELQKMLEYVADSTNRVDYVIVHKVDRLARNRGDDVDITRVLQKAGVKLVSSTESIDESPSGILLHGIMSSIAEFYSRNLANEVIKGLSQKAKNGGTNYRAPLGYKNVRTVDDKGREDRTVVVDEERAPLMKMAFEYYATGDWTISDLAEHLALRGLVTMATPKIPSKPIDRGALNKLLINPYYKGLVYFQGALYPGKHEPLVDKTTWQKVQDVLAAHVNGERTRTFPHYLKSTVYCGNCGSRLIIHNTKNHAGVIYPYFVCAGRHSKRTDCKQKAVLIDEVARQIEKLYERISISKDLRQQLEDWINQKIKTSADEFDKERTRLEREKDKLERKRQKLLEAHYAEAIPLDLLKTEQETIAKALMNIDTEINSHDTHYEVLQDNLKQAFDLIEDCGRAYKLAPDNIKRMFNQAIFDKILVYSEGTVSPQFNEPFKVLINLKNVSVSNATKEEDTNINCTDKQTNLDQCFFDRGSYKRLLVGDEGLEPPTSSLSVTRSNQLS